MYNLDIETHTPSMRPGVWKLGMATCPAAQLLTLWEPMHVLVAASLLLEC